MGLRSFATGRMISLAFDLKVTSQFPPESTPDELDFDRPTPPPLPPPPEPAEAKRMELISPSSKASLSAFEAFNTQRTSFNSSTSASRVATSTFTFA